jgi:hypothetical protein
MGDEQRLLAGVSSQPIADGPLDETLELLVAIHNPREELHKHWALGSADIYNPAPGRRLQIRDNHRRIIGYIERDGDITDKRRRKVGGIEELLQ